jgi:hypothetical protein
MRRGPAAPVAFCVPLSPSRIGIVMDDVGVVTLSNIKVNGSPVLH